MNKINAKDRYFWLFAIIFNLIVAGVIVFLTDVSRNIVLGSDTMYHVYRGQWILEEIGKGNLYPIYNDKWNNGVELMRYWTPFAGYLMAFAMVISRALSALPFVSFHGANPFAGFCVYAGLVYLIGAINWTYIGYKWKRKWMGLFIGELIMFTPTGIYLFYAEGNLPRSLIIAILPLLLYNIVNFFEKREGKSILGVTLSFAAMVMCHVGYAGMVALSILLYIVFYLIVTFCADRKNLKVVATRSFTVIVMLLIGILLTGICLIPATRGGMAQNNQATGQVARLFFQSLGKTLNPFEKYRIGYAYNYFGLAFFLVSVFGTFGCRKKQKPEFMTATTIVVLTSTAFTDILLSMPGGQFMWMLRFLPIVTVLIMFGLLRWDSLKKGILVFVVLALVIDSVQMLRIFQNTGHYQRPEEYFEEIARAQFHDKAKDLIVNRVAFLGTSNCVYYYTGMNGKKQVYGQDCEASTTAHQIREAYDTSEYYYMFDRLIELGADTVVLDKSAPTEVKLKTKKLRKAATKNGYSMISENQNYILYHLDRATREFGVISKFDALAIGNGGIYMARMFPDTELAEDKYLDDFSVSDLKKYRRVYLFKFKYHNVDKAEKLIKEAGKAGVEIYIMADGMPINPHSQTEKFMGVECQRIQFENAFPMIHTKNHGDFVTKLFPENLEDWRTVYMNGLDDTEGYIKVMDNRLSVIGTKYNKNIHFVGLNLTYFYALTRDGHVADLLSNIMSVSEDELPIRRLVPVEVKYGARSITVKTDYNDVNTTLSTHDSFTGDFIVKNNLIHVNRGETVIRMHYPYFKTGLFVSLLGLVLLIVTYKQPLYKRYMQSVLNEDTKEKILK